MAWIRRRSVLRALGFLVGAGGGGAILGGIGLFALRDATGLVWGLAFFVSFVGMLFGIMAPLALVRYLGGRGRSRIARELSTAGGYVAVVVAMIGVVAAAFLLAPPGFRGNPQFGLVVFDIVAGVVFGGIAGLNAVSAKV